MPRLREEEPSDATPTVGEPISNTDADSKHAAWHETSNEGNTTGPDAPRDIMKQSHASSASAARALKQSVENEQDNCVNPPVTEYEPGRIVLGTKSSEIEVEAALPRLTSAKRTVSWADLSGEALTTVKEYDPNQPPGSPESEGNSWDSEIDVKGCACCVM